MSEDHFTFNTITQEIQRTQFGTNVPDVPQHPLVWASCFARNSHTEHGIMRNCTGNHFTIEGLAKMLAYGDWVRAQASRDGSTLSKVMQADVKKYPYDRKQNLEVWQYARSLWQFFSVYMRVIDSMIIC